MSTAALALLLIAQGHPSGGPPAVPSSQPSALAPGGTAADVEGAVTWIFEVDEKMLQVQESWQLKNESGKSVAPDQLHFPLAVGTKRVGLDEASKGFKASEDAGELFATEPLGAQPKQFSAAYFFDFSGDTAVMRRTIPVRLTQARVIVENLPGLQIDANVEVDRRVRDFNGLEFQVVTLAPTAAGATLELKLIGLPARTAWPRRLAVAAAVLIVLLSAWVLRQPLSGAAAKLGPLSAQARRDRIVKAIEILERDLHADKIKEKRYERRHEELMTELARVLREIDLVKSSE